MLILIPCGRGNWHPVQLEMPGGRADLALLNQRMVIELPNGVRREFWVRRVIG